MERKTITVERLLEKIEHGDSLFILDVRDKDKYQTGSLTHDWLETKNIPYAAMIDEEGNVKDLLDQLPDGIDIVTVCTTGNKAHKAAVVLSEKGYSAASLEGGLTAWKEKSN